MSSVRVVDKIRDFAAKNQGAMDRALNRMAIDIERHSKEIVPHKLGALQSSGRHERLGVMNYRVTYGIFPRIPYARFQEMGGDGKRVVRHYSEPGKQAHYLESSGKMVVGRVLNYIDQEVKGIRV